MTETLNLSKSWFDPLFINEMARKKATDKPENLPWHPGLENFLPDQAKCFMETIYGRSSGTSVWHFMEVLSDPEYIRAIFTDDGKIQIWFKELPSQRVLNILGIYGFNRPRPSLMPGSQGVAILISNE